MMMIQYVINLCLTLFMGYHLIEYLKFLEFKRFHSTYQSMQTQENKFSQWLSSIQLDILFGTKIRIEIILSLYMFYITVIFMVILQWLTHDVWLIFACFLFMLIPLLALEYQMGCVRKHIDQQFMALMHALYAGLLQSEDVLHALIYAEKMIEDKYLNRLLKRFNQCVKMGLRSDIAFEQFRKGTFHAYMSYVLINIEQVYNRRGNILHLIENLQVEYTAIQIEINKRKLELKQERMLVVICLCVMLGVCITVKREANYIWLFYQNHHLESVVIMTIAVTVFVTLFILIKSDRLRY